MLQHLLREDSIQLDLKASDREDALRQMIGFLPAADIVDQDRKFLYELLLQREQFGTTAIGDGVAMPHCSFAGVSFPVASLAISPSGINYPSLDGNPVHLLFLCVFPDVVDVASLKKQVFHRAESIFRDRFLQERLKASETPADAHKIIMNEANYSLPALKVAQ
jgi:mannitol/fructose-specific phosphotransferase system IIA component (Ntr-type)